MRHIFCYAVFLLIAIPASSAWAIGINTNTGLTPSQDEYLWRSQIRVARATDESASLVNREVNTLLWQNTGLYGITPRWVGGLSLSYMARGTEAEPGGVRTETEEFGLGDLFVLSKYRVWQSDDRLFTSRFALFGGAEFPTGKEEFSSGSYDFVFGPVYTLQRTLFGRFFEWDADLIYKYNSRASHGKKRSVKQGDVLRYDTSVQYQVYPHELGGEGILNAVFEVNGMFARRTLTHGNRVPNSGFHHVFVSPGLQYAAKRFVVEVAVQIPVLRRSFGVQVEPEVSVVFGIRIVF